MSHGIYRGTRAGADGPQSVLVIEDGGRFYPLAHIVWHSPTGFEWGYEGSGPADLALSILAHAIGERQTASQAKRFDPEGCPRSVRLHQEFKREFIASLPRDPGTIWEIKRANVTEWVRLREEAFAEEHEKWD